MLDFDRFWFDLTGLRRRGAWSERVAYELDDLVRQSGVWYICVEAHTASEAFATDLAKWRVYEGITTADLAAGTGASLINFTQSGIYGAIRSLQGKLRDSLSYMDIEGARGDGVAEGAVFVKALANALATGRSLSFPAGNYNFSDITTPTASGVVELVGDGRDRVTLTGDAAKALVNLNGGGSFKTRGIRFDEWSSACKLNSNAGGTAFDVLEADACWFSNIRVSSISDRSTPADGGINELRFTRNLCTDIGKINAINSAALRLDSNAIYSGFVTHNEIRGVGGATYSGQKDGISLGAVTVTPLSSLEVAGNRIYDVQNSSTDHISGVTVFGRHTSVDDNRVNLVKSASSSNIDQYGIYTKSSYSTITHNKLVNAGGNAACIMTKGYPNDLLGAAFNANDNDNVITGNMILVDSRWAAIDSYVGITTYNAGMNIHDNTIEGLTIGIVKIGQIVVGGNIGRDMIHHNKIRNLVGSATKRAIGVQVVDANRTIVETNEIRSIGSGIEPAAYGVLMENTAGATLQELTVRGNTVETCSAASASNARCIFLSFDAAGTFSDAMVELNNCVSAGRGIQIAFAGTVSKVHVRNNRMDTMSVSHFDSTGTPPTDGVLEGNTVDGADYVTIASGTATPFHNGANHMKINNAGATTISNVSRPLGNMALQLEILDSGNTTIQNNANIKLAGGANWTPAAGGTLTLRRTGGVFKEVCRTAF